MNLAVFLYAVEHVSRVARVLRQPGACVYGVCVYGECVYGVCVCMACVFVARTHALQPPCAPAPQPPSRPNPHSIPHVACHSWRDCDTAAMP
jgi:hypothetical protein